MFNPSFGAMFDLKKVVVIWSLLYVLDAQKDLYQIKKQAKTDVSGCTLALAHVIFRHGDRNPVTLYPNDPWKDLSNWPEGLTRLTKLGIQQQYDLGKYLRERYRSLLRNKGYSRDLVYVQSTDMERTIMSAAAAMAGLFPPERDEIWNPELLWQPVPIHTMPSYLDYMLLPARSCPRLKRALQNYLKSPKFTALYEKHKQLLQYLERNSGMPIRGFEDVQTLYDTLSIEELKNKTLPEWTKPVFGPGTDFESAACSAFQTFTATPELARLTTGFLIRDILERCTQKAERTLWPDRSLWIYSAHDSTIANILNSFGQFYPFTPPYASSVHFDLYKCKTHYNLQVVYRHSNVETLLNFPNCGTTCSIEDFYKIYKEIIPTRSFDEECQLPMYSKGIKGDNACGLNSYNTMSKASKH